MPMRGTDLEAGTALGSCVVEAVLGRGGMGVVYRARQPGLQRTVAVKVIDPVVAADPTMSERFVREARAAAAIEHPNVLPVYEIGTDGERLFTVMRFVESGDLEGFVSARDLTTPDVLMVMSQIAGALDASHSAGLIHRDVKPQNILVDTSNGDLFCYLADFGLARRVADVGLTLPGAAVGTPWYMSPEQALGQPLDARTDIYALGCVLYELLTGDVPFPEEEWAAVLLAHQLAEVPQLADARPDLPRRLDDVLARALAKDRDERFPSAGDLARAVAAAFAGRPGPVPESSVAAGAAALREDFPDPTPEFIHTQCPRMTPEKFERFLAFLSDRGWSKADIRELVHPWAPRDWKKSRA
jgi:serine/threonine protein kinase